MRHSREATPYRRLLISLDDPPHTPTRTPTGMRINPKIIRSLDAQGKVAVECSNKLDEAIRLAHRIIESVPPEKGS